MRSRINYKVFSSIQKKQITSGFACLSAVQKNDHIGARFGHVTAKIPKFLVVFKKIRLKLRLPLVLLSEFSLYFLSSTPLFNSFALLFSSELNTNYLSFRLKIYTVFTEPSSLTFHWTRLKTSPLLSPSKFPSLPFFWRQILSHPTTTTLSFKWDLIWNVTLFAFFMNMDYEQRNQSLNRTTELQI